MKSQSEQPQTIDKEDVFDFIFRRPCASLATSREGSSADLAHVFVYSDENFNGYFLSKLDTRKIDNIRDNPHVTLLFSDIEHLQQVEYIGNAKVIDDSEEIKYILPKIQDVLEEARADYWVPPVAQVPGDEYCLVELTPMAITYRDYAKEDDGAEAHQFKIDINAV